MRTHLVPAAAYFAAAVAFSGVAFGQPGDTTGVTAASAGVFTFNIAGASFSFGNVNANGTVSSTGIPGARNGTNTGAVYTATAATTWTSSSAPSRTVRIFNASTTSTIAWGTADRLSLRIPNTGLPPPANSCGYKVFSSTGDGGMSCGGGNLLRLLFVGNGANSRTGTLDLRLEVLDTDVAGTNSWTVVLTANGF